MKKIILLLVAIALLASCGSTIQTSTIINGKRFKATNPRDIEIYTSEESAPNNYKEVGLIVSHTKLYVPLIIIFDVPISILIASGQAPDNANYRNRPVFKELIYKAAALGADGIIIKNFYKNGIWKTITAVAIKKG